MINRLPERSKLPVPDQAKLLVHDITNKLQSVLGYFELKEYSKAAAEIQDVLKLLGRLRTQVISLCARQQ